VAFAEDRLGFCPDPWQARLLRSTARQLALNVCRQGGKSTTVAVLALHTALYVPGSLTLLVSPSQRQSRELFAKVMDFLRSLEPVEQLDEDNRLSATLANRSRIVSLPGDPKTVRGYSGPALVVEDEAGYVDDDMVQALRPMLAVSRGRLILMSTPAGRRGHFFETCIGTDGDWERVFITAKDCPRISAAFLAKELETLGPLLFAQEYEGEFIDAQTSAFASAMIDRALVDDFEPFLGQGLQREATQWLMHTA
jgi:hypothetical protein